MAYNAKHDGTPSARANSKKAEQCMRRIATHNARHKQKSTSQPIMRPPPSPRARRLRRLAKLTAMLTQVLELLSLLDELEALDKHQRPKHRSTLVPRERRSWAVYTKPILADGSFRSSFRMEHDDFMDLVNMVRPLLERNPHMGSLRNGAVPVEYQVGNTLRWLAGGQMQDITQAHVIARSTAYQTATRVLKAINACTALKCEWPDKDSGFADIAAGFKQRSSKGVIESCAGAMDGLFIRMTRPVSKDTHEPNSFYSGHKKGFGMNFQAICDAQYRIRAWTMNSPGSQNDRTAFKVSGFGKLLEKLPKGYYIVGDAAYPGSDVTLVPYPGAKVTDSQDAFNYYLSQCRIAIEQTFGILVRRWGILWKPLELRLANVPLVVESLVRLHNYCRTRNIEVPAEPAAGVRTPKDFGFTKSGNFTNDFFAPASCGRTGRPKNDQAGVSGPREAIRRQLEVLGMGRPAHNIARNKDRKR